jgi:hypothetical protein
MKPYHPLSRHCDQPRLCAGRCQLTMPALGAAVPSRGALRVDAAPPFRMLTRITVTVEDSVHVANLDGCGCPPPPSPPHSLTPSLPHSLTLSLPRAPTLLAPHSTLLSACSPILTPISI